jgi:hypothetical protein
MTPESAGHSYSAAVTDDRPLAAVDRTEGERTADVGWEPPDWAAVLRRHRRRQTAVAAGMVAFFGVVTPLLLVVVQGRSLGPMYWIWLLITIVCVVEAVLSRVTADGRAQWERETRQDVRISHALRHHVGIGTTDRSLVIERARTSYKWAKVAFVGWPLLGAVFVAGVLDDELPAALGVPLVLLCLLLVGRAVWRARLARRWLADPLPREEQAA